MTSCGESNEECGMKETLETPVESKEHDLVLEQVEEAEIIEEEELVEDLGDAEPPWESRIVETSIQKFVIDAEEDSAQPPRHVPYEELDGTDQEASFFDDDDQESSSPNEKLASAMKLFEIEGSSSSEYEDVVEVDFSQPPTYDLSDEEEIEDFDQDVVAVEEVYKEVELFTEKYKEVELEIPLETPLPRPLPPNTNFKWVKSLAFIFTFPLEFGLLETDGQLRALCGCKSKREMVSNRSWHPRFNMVPRSKWKCNDWCRARLNGFRKMFAIPIAYGVLN